MSVSRNAAYNFVGAALPSVLTLVTVPLYLHIIGVERYGFLTLCWVILGYSGFLEWGLGTAIAQSIASDGAERRDHGSDIFWNGLWLTLVVGVFGAVLMYLGAALYFANMGNVGGEFAAELAAALPLLSGTAPVLVMGGLIAGSLQGRERFLALNLIGSLGYTLLAALPLLVAYVWTAELWALVLASFVARIITFPIGLSVISKALPLRAPSRPSWSIMRRLLGFSGWVAVTQISNGVLATIDRLAIGARVGAAAVPTYAIPFGLVSRVTLVPHSLGGALFPRFAAADAEERKRLVAAAIQAIMVIVTPLTIGILAFAEPFFQIWIGEELAAAAAPVAYILAAGFWIYCISYIPFLMIQASGRPSVVSKLLLAELIPFALLLFLCLSWLGVPGAALAFALRLAGECAALLYLTRTPLSALRTTLLPGLLVVSAVAARMLTGGWLSHALLGGLLMAALLWSLFNIPDVLRPFLKPIERLLPARARA